MVRSTTLVGLAALSVASAEPLPKRGSFKLPLTRRAVSKVIDDSSLTDIYTNTDWTTEVSFGGQKFSLQVDTGSSDIWVLSSDMSSNDQKQFPSNHFFDSSKSKSFKSADGATFNITYDAGEIFGAGKVGKDDVSIGKLSVNMPFGLGSQVTSHGMVDKMYDGMLGLAFGAASTQKPNRGPTFMEAIQSQLDAPVFTWHAPLTGAGHMLEFGHVDKNLYDGDLKTAKVNNGTSENPVGWMTQLTFSMGGKNISSKLESAVVDTGGLAAQASQDTVAAYWGQVKGAMDSSSGNDGTLWLFPCNGQLPDLTYDFLDKDGKTVSATVPGKFFNSTQQSSDPSLCVGAFTAKGASGVGQVGYPFLHSFFTVFDQSVPSVSFASYKKEELDGKALEGGSSTTATSEGLKPHATGNSTAGAAGATGTGAVHATSTPSSGSAAASASPSASGSAQGGSQHSGATGLQPSVIIAMVAAVLGLFA